MIAEPNNVSEAQLDILREVLTSSETPIKPIAPNNRPLQPLNGRAVSQFQPHINCSVTPWSAWSPCNDYCGDSTQFRVRSEIAGSSVGARVHSRNISNSYMPSRDLECRARVWSLCRTGLV